MNVKLISLTQSQLHLVCPNEITVEDGNRLMTAEELIVYIARVSSNQHTEAADRLIKYLVKNKHWSPFEMADMTVEIITSRAIAQQILRHRSFSFQEFSQRYAAVTDFEPVQIRKQAEKNRQSSTDEFNPGIDLHNGEANTTAAELIENHIKQSEHLYKTLLKVGVAKECARMILPLTTQTKLYMKGSIRSWIHYLYIRCEEHTQLEHRQIALPIRDIFIQHFPVISLALGNFETDEQR